METLKKIGLLFVLFAALVGAGCSLGWLGYQKEWFAFIGALIVAAMAAPTWYNLLQRLLK